MSTTNTCCDEDVHHIHNDRECVTTSALSSSLSCHSSANSSLQRFHSSFNDLDLDGLEESLVDDNNHTLNDDSQRECDDTIVDNVLTRLRAALIRESSQRSEEEIEAITAYVDAIGACRQFDANTRRRLARAFVLAEIESTNTRVLTRGERLDAFCVVACGALRVITRDGIERFLTVGDEFGGATRSGGVSGGEEGVGSAGGVSVGDEELSVGAEMWTNDDFVWVLCVPHALFDDIVLNDQTIPFKTVCDDSGHVIEVRNNHNQLMRATKTRLTRLLFECVAREGGVGGGGGGGPPSPTITGVNACDTDSTFIDDYLLTFRAWQPLNTCESDDSTCDSGVANACEPTVQLMTRIVDTMTSQHERTGCVRLVLQWIESHFQDFTSNVLMTSLLRRFEDQLKGHVSSFRSEFKLHLKLYYLALSAKSRDRRVTLNRNNSEDAPPFTVIGGYESHSALFVDHVNEDDVTYGVTRGDRLIQINGIDVTNHVTITRANQLLTSSSVVSLVVRFDPSAYYSLKQIMNENKDKQRNHTTMTRQSSQHVSTQSSDHILLSTSPSHTLSRSEVSLQPNGGSVVSSPQSPHSSHSSTRVHHKWSSLQALNSLMSRILPKALNSVTNMSALQHASQVVSLASSASASQLLLLDTVDSARHHHSNGSSLNTTSGAATHRFPVTSFGHNSDSKVEVLKVYYEKEFRFLVIRRETTAREVVQLALREFSLNNTNYSSRDFALYEIQATPRSTSPNNTSSGGVTSSSSTPSHVSAVRRMADSASDLVTNLSLNSRVYLKPITQTASVAHSDSIAKEIAHENPSLSLLSLDGASVAMEITRRDFAVFASIESQQFVYDVMGVMGGDRTRELSRFECLSNEEMFWTIDECLRYRTSIAKRVKTIKQFIKIAGVCRALNNYNTMFAILSGLQHVTVSRLRQTWDRVPHKHQKQLKALQTLLDPSRNMCRYRHALSATLAPAIPFFPLVKKDIAFVHLANESLLAVSAGDTSDSDTRRPLLVNWDKMRLLSQKIRQSVSFAENAHLLEHAFVQYAFGGNASNTSTSTTPPVIAVTQKKLWDHSVMTKRVQRYLSDTFQSVCTDEQAFMSRSVDCEAPPPLASASSSGALERRSHTSSTCSAQSSPTPSMASSCSTATSSSFGGTSVTFRTRFGAQSPQQLRKLLALSSSSHPLMPSSNNDHTCHQHNTHHSSLSHHSHHNNSHHSAHPHSSHHNTLQSHSHHTCHQSLSSSSSALVPSLATAVTTTTLSSQLIACHACQLSSQQQSSHVSSNARVVTSLPVESSSVTSLRRLEQLQQLSRFRDQWRRPLPDYQQTMERRLRQTSDSRIHVQMSPNATQSVSSTTSAAEVSSKVTSEHVV